MAQRRRRIMLDPDADRWMAQTAWENIWRVAAAGYEIEDLLQEGRMCRHIAEQRYGHVVKNKRHLMALFMRTFINRIHDLARGASRLSAIENLHVEDVPLECQRVADKDAEMEAFINDAPEKVGKVIRGLINADPREIRARYRHRPNGSRETRNERLCRLAGIERTPGIEYKLREYLGGMLIDDETIPEPAI